MPPAKDVLTERATGLSSTRAATMKIVLSCLVYLFWKNELKLNDLVSRFYDQL